MGNYNPHAPYILGQEWVPIRQPNILPDNITEFGYRWSNGHTVTPVTGCYYIAQVPDSRVSQTCDLLAIYPDGLEDQTGPIKILNIPVSAVAATGSNVDISAGFTALNNPSDDASVRFQTNSAGSQIAISFDTASYSQQLLGKRILDVSLRYSMTGTPTNLNQVAFFAGFANNLGTNTIIYKGNAEGTPVGQKNAINSFSATDLNPFWQAGINPNLNRDIYPWRYQELNRFAATEPAASRMVFFVVSSIPNDGGLGVVWWFSDLQITYCEEQRVKYGGRRTSNLNANPNSGDAYNAGPQFVKMVDPATLTSVTSLAPGDYVNTLNHNDLGINIGFDGAPILNAVRELYQLPNQRGLQLGQSLSAAKTFTVTGSAVLPHLTMHHTGGVVTGSHAYGITAGAPVYGAITAIQEIEDDVAPAASTQFPQVRFYARRFGDTTVPLRLIDVASGTFTVSITVAAFDALPEIVDGWKEVTLRFASPPSFAVAAGDPDWRWDAVGETAGNQWQVLVASATSPTGTQQIGPANYLAPTGDQNTLTWMSPAISGTAADTLSDAVLIFSQDPPTVTGFAVGTSTQTVTGFTLNCGVPKACIPTGIYCNNLTWAPFGACATFSVVTVDSWPPADTGQAWTLSGGTAADFDDDGQRGTITIPTGDANARNAVLAGNYTDVRFDGVVRVSQVATVQAIVADVLLRVQDTSNFYRATFGFTTTGLIDMSIVRVVAGVGTSLGSANGLLSYTASSDMHFTFTIIGSTLSLKAWITPDEPIGAPQIVVTDTTYTSGQAGVRGRIVAGNTNVNPVISFDNFIITPDSLIGGSVEIQRRDSLTDWQTIFNAQSATAVICVTGFCDFEARAGVLSEYRIRTLNVLDFAGPWVTGSGTLPVPGVTSPNTSTANSVLIFTSNKRPASNLAYRMQWEGTPVEQFAFPEADQVQLQQMFGKDFVTAFHPLERGGDRFQRVILVSAATIPVESLANFNSLRDMAWADIPYVCVRDELGNRWYATILVPGGSVRRNRKIYLAQIEVIETTSTPFPVNP